MWMHSSSGRGRSRRETLLETRLSSADTLIPEQRSDSGVPRLEREPGGGNQVDVEEQLRRLEVRLLAEVGGDPAVESAVRRHLHASCARFATARVRTFVPILVEREVRRRLRDEAAPA
jgi:hypothetical protein